LLAEHGLSSQLHAAGRAIDRIELRVDGALVKNLDLPMPALSISQGAFEELLLKELRENNVEIKTPYLATAFEQEPGGVRTHIQRREPLGSPAHCEEWEGVEASSIDSAFVIGADGYNSCVRVALGLDNLDVAATELFAMFEGPDAGTGGRSSWRSRPASAVLRCRCRTSGHAGDFSSCQLWKAHQTSRSYRLSRTRGCRGARFRSKWSGARSRTSSVGSRVPSVTSVSG